jgi:NhaA family Na+:H+ antiporter
MTMKRVIPVLQEFSVPLISGVILAMLWVNIASNSYHDFIHGNLLGPWLPLGNQHPISFHFLMNDIFMVLFFGIAGKEIAEAVLPGGALNPIKKAINPLLGTVGGVVGPALVYLAYVYYTGSYEITLGWGIPTATDIALAWLVAKLIFGASHPAVSFLLLLAVADDGIGLGIIAIFYGDPSNPARPQFLLLVVAAMLGSHILRRKNVKNFWPYLIGPGILSWLGLMLSHLHPALALVFIVPFMPAASRDRGLFADDEGSHDTLNQFEHAFKLPVDIGLFGFGLANAGVALSSVGDATWAVFLGLSVGKFLGVFGFSSIATGLGYPLPDGMNFKSLAVVATIAGLGLTVALFVAGVAFSDPAIQGAAKMGAMMSVLVAPLAVLLAKILGLRKKT